MSANARTPLRLLASLALVGCPEPSEQGGGDDGSTSAGSDATSNDPGSSGPDNPGDGTDDDASGGTTSGNPDDGTESSGDGPDDGSGDDTSTGEPDDGTVPLQVLSIHGGRFMRSCDTGLSWSEPWEEDPAADCFHDPDSLYARPVYGNGVFVAASGWGDPGAMYTSTDAVTWTRTPGPDLAGLRGENTTVNSSGAFFDGESIGVMRWLTTTDGATWALSEQDFRPPGIGNVRRVAYSTADDLLVVKGNDADLFISTDWAVTWSDPTIAGDACPTSIQHRGEIVIGHDRIVLGAGDGLCWSDDVGQSWTHVDTSAGVSDLVVMPDGFVSVLADGTVQSSPDADAWNTIGMLPFDPDTSAAIWAGEDDVIAAIATTNAGDSAMLRSSDGGASWSETQAGPATGCPRLNLETFMVPAALCE